jgi:hypothetical protein
MECDGVKKLSRKGNRSLNISLAYFAPFAAGLPGGVDRMYVSFFRLGDLGYGQAISAIARITRH